MLRYRQKFALNASKRNQFQSLAQHVPLKEMVIILGVNNVVEIQENTIEKHLLVFIQELKEGKHIIKLMIIGDINPSKFLAKNL